MGRPEPDKNESGSEGDLQPLIETEIRLEKLLAQAKSGAERLVATAQATVRAAEERTELELEEEARALRRDAEQEREKGIESIRTLGCARAAAFDAVTGDRVTELAAYVVRRVIGEPA